MAIAYENEKYSLQDKTVFRANEFGITVADIFRLNVKNKNNINVALLYRAHGKTATHVDAFGNLNLFDDELFVDVVANATKFIDQIDSKMTEEIAAAIAKAQEESTVAEDKLAEVDERDNKAK